MPEVFFLDLRRFFFFLLVIGEQKKGKTKKKKQQKFHLWRTCECVCACKGAFFCGENLRRKIYGLGENGHSKKKEQASGQTKASCGRKEA